MGERRNILAGLRPGSPERRTLLAQLRAAPKADRRSVLTGLNVEEDRKREFYNLKAGFPPFDEGLATLQAVLPFLDAGSPG